MIPFVFFDLIIKEFVEVGLWIRLNDSYKNN